ncbi:hypothetical protein VaNZ11_008900 [Volvox africanus]|uniref:Uncharacterized protein n=1 Tax=Volvox africanus TaxID=51714 RepID=A0ABQ5S6T9_9CHLO|nr:hypothetical protein VaNZ11_008900 [Volvox africanus]
MAVAAVAQGQKGIGAAEAQDILTLSTPCANNAAAAASPPRNPLDAMSITFTRLPRPPDGMSSGLYSPGTPVVSEWSLRSPKQLYFPPSAPSASAPPLRLLLEQAETASVNRVVLLTMAESLIIGGTMRCWLGSLRPPTGTSSVPFSVRWRWWRRQWRARRGIRRQP